MSSEPPAPPQPLADESPLIWEDGQPRSRLYGDIYFSTEDGLAETRAVFLQGCGLPDAWAGRSRFVVGELGFGTGLNILALLDLWRTTSPPDAHLHIFSVEAHPLSADEARLALARWPELADLAQPLLAAWPGRAHGFHRVDLPQARAILDLAVMDVGEALTAWTGRADAWFLDGFSPALNPGMWRDEVLALVAQRSAPGARAATFTVAGAVRRGLQAAGFEIEKQPGHGRKRQRLEARLPGAAKPPQPADRVAVIGAGIAGASTARALRALGWEAVVYDAVGPGAGASGNPAALVTPRLDAGLEAPARLLAQAFSRAVALYEQTPQAVIARGALQLPAAERDPERFTKIAAADLFEPGTLTLLGAEAIAERLGEPGPAGLEIGQALVIEPAALLAAWAGEVRKAAITGLEAVDGGWILHGPDGEVVDRVAAVVLAAGQASTDLWPGLPLRPVRGQASFTQGPRPGTPAAAWGGYVLPTRDGVLFGATHDRGETGVEVRDEDHDRNRATLAAGMPGLAAELAKTPLEGRAGLRATTPDSLPLAGAAAGAPAGLFLLAGFGARGFSMAPLLAEHVAALITGAPSPLPAAQTEIVDPARFIRRAARRNGG